MSEKKQGDSIAEALEKVKKELRERQTTGANERERRTREIVALREPLVRHFLRLTRNNKHDAEDLAQDTVARALNKIDQHDGQNISAWVYTIGTNLFLTKKRKHSIKNELLSEDGEVDAEVELPPHDPFLRELIVEGATHLPANYQELIALWLKNYTIEEIVAETQLPRGTVASRLFRARAMLREFLKAKGHEFA